MRALRTRLLLAVTVVMMPLAGASSVGHSQASAASVSPTVVDTVPPPPGVDAVLDSARARRGGTLTISLYTYGPSDVYFERFGHVAIGIHDRVTGRDVAFNWGIFNFDQPNFLLRFLTGDTKYQMAGYETRMFNGVYRDDNRSIRQQVLAMTPVEKSALAEFIAWNSREEHKYYRYDYYSDNCSTRVRDALDRVLGGRLHAALTGTGGARTWRGETARLLGSMLPLYAGIEVALGRRADEPLSKWDEEFLPEHMATHYEKLVLTDAGGTRYRLVNRDTMLFVASRVPLPGEPPSRDIFAALLGLTLAGLLASLADARATVARVVLVVGVALWYLVGGVLGTALLLAATVTKHAPYMGANTTLLSLQPLLLVAAVLVPIALWRGVRSRAAMGVAALIALMSICGVLLQLVPSLTQSSNMVLGVVVPIHVAIAVALWRVGHHRGGRRP